MHLDRSNYAKTTRKTEQVTRGHNIVTDGRAGASNPASPQTPYQPPSLKDGWTKPLIELRVRN